jgi:hypothetical protein
LLFSSSPQAFQSTIIKTFQQIVSVLFVFHRIALPFLLVFVPTQYSYHLGVDFHLESFIHGQFFHCIVSSTCEILLETLKAFFRSPRSLVSARLFLSIAFRDVLTFKPSYSLEFKFHSITPLHTIGIVIIIFTTFRGLSIIPLF